MFSKVRIWNQLERRLLTIKRQRFSIASKSGEPVVPSITLASTYGFDTVENASNVAFGNSVGHFYTRWGNPTVELLENKINELESGSGCLMFSSGMCAISSAIIANIHPGDHIIVPINLYSGTIELFEKWLPYKNDIQITWVNHDINEYQQNIKSNTKLLYCESPSNPSNCIIDLTEFTKLADKYSIINNNKILTLIDSTFAGPFNVLPIKDHNIDIIIHSATKILNGHTDVTAGTVICKDKHIYDNLLDYRRIYGPILSPFDCYLIYRGLKTLPIRSDRINKNAMRIAQWIENEQSDIVSKVHYCGLPSFGDGYENATKNLRKKYDGDLELFWDLSPGYGGTFAFEINDIDRETCRNALDQLKIITKAVSLGGTESLIEHPASMTHNESLFEEKDNDSTNKQMEISEGLVRLNIGLEPPELIMQDLQQMFDFVSSVRNVK